MAAKWKKIINKTFFRLAVRQPSSWLIATQVYTVHCAASCVSVAVRVQCLQPCLLARPISSLSRKERQAEERRERVSLCVWLARSCGAERNEYFFRFWFSYSLSSQCTHLTCFCFCVEAINKSAQRIRLVSKSCSKVCENFLSFCVMPLLQSCESLFRMESFKCLIIFVNLYLRTEGIACILLGQVKKVEVTKIYVRKKRKVLVIPKKLENTNCGK